MSKRYKKQTNAVTIWKNNCVNNFIQQHSIPMGHFPHRKEKVISENQIHFYNNPEDIFSARTHILLLLPLANMVEK